LLRSLGMPLDSFRITSTDDWTVSSITFPLNQATVDHYLQSTSGSN
jgi:hypothetical protein